MKEVDKEASFLFSMEKGHVVSLVGAGGKTTLMYRLAEYYSGCGYRVLVTTTTHIMKPERYLAHSLREAQEQWEKGNYAVVGKNMPGEKLAEVDREELCAYMEMADMVLIEADGAKKMPCKVPAEHEPVILPQCDIVLGVMGMDSLGQSLESVCFRLKEAKKFLGKSERDILTVEDAEKILTSSQGTRKNVGGRMYGVVLSKCVDEQTREYAQQIRNLLYRDGVIYVECV